MIAPLLPFYYDAFAIPCVLDAFRWRNCEGCVSARVRESSITMAEKVRALNTNWWVW